MEARTLLRTVGVKLPRIFPIQKRGCFMDRIKVYQPQYFKKFQCIGSDCRETCCQRWDIAIDEETYGKYMSLEEDTRNGIVKRIIVTGQEPFSAKMSFNDQRRCFFLNNRRLCDIQARHGHEYLSHTCRTYPRKYCVVGNEAEAFLSLSCEAAAKVVLFERNIMMFEDCILECEGSMLFNNTLEADKYAVSGNAIDIFWTLRTVSILAAQSRHYRFRVRMLILGIYIKQASELLAEGRHEDIAAHAEKFIERLDTEFYDSLSEQVPGKDNLELQFVLGLLNDMSARASLIGDVSLGRFIANACAGMDISPDGEPLESFADDYNKYYEMYFADKEYILENFVVNHIFSSGFPFNYKFEDSIMKNYRELLVKYNMIKFLLVGVCRNSMKFDKRKVVECVASFSRAYDHHRGGALKMK